MAESLPATAAPAGLTCLKEAAAGLPAAASNSRTSCQAPSASRKLMYPGLPLSTSRPASSGTVTPAGVWCGLQPYFSSISMLSPPLNRAGRRIRWVQCIRPRWPAGACQRGSGCARRGSLKSAHGPTTRSPNFPDQSRLLMSGRLPGRSAACCGLTRHPSPAFLWDRHPAAMISEDESCRMEDLRHESRAVTHVRVSRARRVGVLSRGRNTARGVTSRRQSTHRQSGPR